MNSFKASSKVASMDSSKSSESYGKSAGKKTNNMSENDGIKKKKGKTKEIIPGEGFGTTLESLSSSSDAAIGSVTTSSAGTLGISKSPSSAKRKNAMDQNKKISHEIKEMKREK